MPLDPFWFWFPFITAVTTAWSRDKSSVSPGQNGRLRCRRLSKEEKSPAQLPVANFCLVGCINLFLFRPRGLLRRKRAGISRAGEINLTIISHIVDIYIYLKRRKKKRRKRRKKNTLVIKESFFVRSASHYIAQISIKKDYDMRKSSFISPWSRLKAKKKETTTSPCFIVESVSISPRRLPTSLYHFLFFSLFGCLAPSDINHTPVAGTYLGANQVGRSPLPLSTESSIKTYFSSFFFSFLLHYRCLGCALSLTSQRVLGISDFIRLLFNRISNGFECKKKPLMTGLW